MRTGCLVPQKWGNVRWQVFMVIGWISSEQKRNNCVRNIWFFDIKRTICVHEHARKEDDDVEKTDKTIWSLKWILKSFSNNRGCCFARAVICTCLAFSPRQLWLRLMGVGVLRAVRHETVQTEDNIIRKWGFTAGLTILTINRTTSLSFPGQSPHISNSTHPVYSECAQSLS